MDILIKRLKAYTLDLIIVISILTLLALIYHPDITAYQTKLNDLSKEYFLGNVNLSSYIYENSKIMKVVDEKSIIVNIINIIIITIYFIIIPYFNDGATIGKKINSIKVRNIKKEKLTIKSLIIRNLIITGLLYFISVAICTILIPKNYYFLIISTISFIQIILLVISLILMLKRKDKRGLHEILSRTYVK